MHLRRISFISQSLITLDENKQENPIAKMMISVLGTVGEMQRSQIKENQRQGIEIAKLKGIKVMSGRILSRNTKMLELVKHAGFSLRADEDTAVKVAMKEL